MALAGLGVAAPQGPSRAPGTGSAWTRTTSQDSLGLRLLTFKSKEDGQSVTTVLGPDGKPMTVEARSAGGALLWRRSWEPGRWTEERFVPTHGLTAVTPGPKGKRNEDLSRISWTEWGADGKAWTASTIAESAQYDDFVCRPDAPANSKELLSDLSWIRGAVDSRLSFHPGCAAQAPAIQKALSTALTDGLACLNRLGGIARLDAAALTAYFQPEFSAPISIQCGDEKSGMVSLQSAVAMAHVHPMPTYPGMDINIDHRDIKGSSARSAGVIFHEMLHWLGYRHGGGFDMPYIAEACCFGKPDPRAPLRESALEAQKLACGMLEKPSHWTSVDYAMQYSRFMKLRYHGDIAVTHAFKAASARFRLPSGRVDGLGLFMSALETAEPYHPETRTAALSKGWRETGAPIQGMIWAHTALGPDAAHSGVLPSQRAGLEKDLTDRLENIYYPGPQNAPHRRFARELGSLMNAVLNKEVDRAKEIARTFFAAGGTHDQICPLLSLQEAKEVRDAGRQALFLAMDVPGLTDLDGPGLNLMCLGK